MGRVGGGAGEGIGGRDLADWGKRMESKVGVAATLTGSARIASKVWGAAAIAASVSEEAYPLDRDLVGIWLRLTSACFFRLLHALGESQCFAQSLRPRILGRLPNCSLLHCPH